MYGYELNQLGPAEADGDGRDSVADCSPDDPAVFTLPGEVSELASGTDRLPPSS